MNYLTHLPHATPRTAIRLLMAASMFVLLAAACGSDEAALSPEIQDLKVKIESTLDHTYTSTAAEDEQARGDALTFDDLQTLLADPANNDGYTYSTHFTKSDDDGEQQVLLAASVGIASAVGGTELFIDVGEAGLDAENSANLQAWHEDMSLLFDIKNVWIGGWRNPETNQYEINLSLVFKDLEPATQFGAENDQIAVFDLSTFENIPTGGSGSPGYDNEDG